MAKKNIESQKPQTRKRCRPSRLVGRCNPSELVLLTQLEYIFMCVCVYECVL